MKLREFKHSFGARDRILTLLPLENAEARPWDPLWQGEDGFDSFGSWSRTGILDECMEEQATADWMRENRGGSVWAWLVGPP